MKYFEKKEVISILLLLIVVGLIRFYKFTYWSIDVDEAFTPRESQKVDLNTFIDYIAFRNADLLKDTTTKKSELTELFLVKTFPLYYLLNHQIIKIFRVNEFSLRLLSVIFGILAVLVVFLIGKEFFNFETAIIASFFTIFHPLIHFHSQNARFYSMGFLFSVLLIYSSLRFRTIILNETNSQNKLFFFLFGLFIWLPMLVHGSLLFTLVFVSLVFLNIIMQKGVSNFFKKTVCMIPSFLIMGFFVLINQIIFLKGRFGIMAVPNDLLQIGGSRLLHNIFSLIFNFGYHFWIIIPIAIWILFNDNNKIYKIMVISFVINLLIYILLSFKTYQVRHDYFMPVLPVFLFIIAYTIVKCVNIICTNKDILSVKLTPYIIMLFFIILMMPTFISNLLIDGNRLDWKGATSFIKQYSYKKEIGKTIIICSPGPKKISFYLNENSEGIKSTKLRMLDIDSLGRNNDKVIFVVIPLTRAGFDLRNIPKRIIDSIFSKGRLLKIIGKNRFDIRICKLAIFKI